MTKSKYSIGIDLGGTTVKLGIVTSDGKIKKKIKLDTNAEKGPDAVIGQIIKGVDKILNGNRKQIDGIGIGSPGLVTSKKGLVQHPPNFPGWDSVPLGAILKKEFNTKVYVENDANAAAVGELIFGAGQKFSDFIMVTLGTGVGGGIIIKNKLYKGVTGAAGEIGHLKIDYKGLPCKCGATGCLEAYAGNNYLVNNVKQKLQKKSSLLNEWVNKNNQIITPKLIHEAAVKGDVFAISVIEELAGHLGSGLSSVVNLLDITNIIIGGGVSGFGKFLFVPLVEKLKENVMNSMRERIKVVPAKLKNNAGIKGASALVFYKM